MTRYEQSVQVELIDGMKQSPLRIKDGEEGMEGMAPRGATRARPGGMPGGEAERRGREWDHERTRACLWSVAGRGLDGPEAKGSPPWSRVAQRETERSGERGDDPRAGGAPPPAAGLLRQTVTESTIGVCAYKSNKRAGYGKLMAHTMKKIQDVQLPEDLVPLLQARGLGGKRVYVPAKDRNPQIHDNILKILEEVESVYEATGLRFYGRFNDMKPWSSKFSAVSISRELSISMRSAQRLRPVAISLWKRFFRATEIQIIRRLENCANAYQLDYMELNLFYRRGRASVRKGVAETSPWLGTRFDENVQAELKECWTTSIEKRPWNPKNDGSQQVDMQRELDSSTATAVERA